MRVDWRSHLRPLSSRTLSPQPLATPMATAPLSMSPTSPRPYTEGPSTQYSRSLVPSIMPLRAFGTRVLKYCAPGPLGFQLLCPEEGLTDKRAMVHTPWKGVNGLE